MSTLSDVQGTCYAATQARCSQSPERTWAQVAAQVSHQPLTSAIQPNPLSQVRKNNGTVRLAQQAKRHKVDVPRNFGSRGRAAPSFSCSPLSSPSGSRQSSLSSTKTIVIPLASSRQRKYTYTQESGESPQCQTSEKEEEESLSPTCKSKQSTPGSDMSSSGGSTSEFHLRNDNPFWVLRMASPRLSESSSSGSSSQRSESPFVFVESDTTSSSCEVKLSASVANSYIEGKDQIFLKKCDLNAVCREPDELQGFDRPPMVTKEDKPTSFKGPRSSRDRPRPVVLNEEEKSQLQGYERAVLSPVSSPCESSPTRSDIDTWTRCKNNWNVPDLSQSFKEKNKSRMQQLLKLIHDGQNGSSTGGSTHYKGDSDDAISPVQDDSDIDVPVSVFNALASPSSSDHQSAQREHAPVLNAQEAGLPNPLKTLLRESHGDAFDKANPLWSRDSCPCRQRDGCEEDLFDLAAGSPDIQEQKKPIAGNTPSSRIDAPVMNLQDLFDRYRGRTFANVTQKIDDQDGPKKKHHQGAETASNTSGSPSLFSQQQFQSQSLISSPPQAAEPTDCGSSIPFGWKKPTVLPVTSASASVPGAGIPEGFDDGSQEALECRQEAGFPPGSSPFLNPTAPSFMPMDWQIIKKRIKPYREYCLHQSVQPPSSPAATTQHQGQYQNVPAQILPPQTPQLRPVSPQDHAQLDIELLPSPYRSPRFDYFSTNRKHTRFVPSSPTVMTTATASSYSSVPSSPSDARQMGEWQWLPARMMSGFKGAQNHMLEQQHHHHNHHHPQHQQQQQPQQQPRQYSLSPHRKYAYAHPSVYEVAPAANCAGQQPMMVSGHNGDRSGSPSKLSGILTGLRVTDDKIDDNGEEGNGHAERAGHEIRPNSNGGSKNYVTVGRTSHLDWFLADSKEDATES